MENFLKEVKLKLPLKLFTIVLARNHHLRELFFFFFFTINILFSEMSAEVFKVGFQKILSSVTPGKQ